MPNRKVDEEFIANLAANLQFAATDHWNANTRAALDAVATALIVTLRGMTWKEAKAHVKQTGKRLRIREEPPHA